MFGFALAFGLGFSAPDAHALSCVPTEMYLEGIVEDENDGTFVFTGAALKVTEDHTQVVTVTEAHKGWVAPRVWVEHQYSDDWQYFCSNGPAKAGEPTIFLATVDAFGMFTVAQTLPASSDMAKDFIASLEEAGAEGDITEATPDERTSELMESVKRIIALLGNIFAELRYWQSQ